MGAWRFMLPRLHELACRRRAEAADARLRRARGGSASPATGFHEDARARAEAHRRRRHCHEGSQEWPLSSTVPPLGESITEAVVGKWHKKVGDAVAVDEPLVVLETDKVTIDVPAPAAGALATIALQGGRQGEGRRGAGHHRRRRRRRRSGAAAPPPARAAPPRPPRRAPRRRAQRVATPRVTPDRRASDRRGQRARPRASCKGSGAGRPDHQGRRAAVSSSARPRPPPAPAPAPAAPLRPRAPTPTREERVKMTPLRKRVAERLLAGADQRRHPHHLQRGGHGRGDGAAQAVRREVPGSATA